MKRKIFTTIFLVSMMFSSLTVNAEEGIANSESIFEEEKVESEVVFPGTENNNAVEGVCGEGVNYRFNCATKTLYLTGEGIVYDYKSFSELPWSSRYYEMESAVLESGISVKLWMISPKAAHRSNKLGEVEKLFAESRY